MMEMFFIWLVTFLISDYFRPRLPEVTPSGEGDFQSPTATEGRKIPQVVGGTIRMKAPNVLWQGEWDFEPVTVETGIVFKEDETIGYKYRIAMALGMFFGECAGMTRIWIGDDIIWDYNDSPGGGAGPQTVVDVDLPELFGGETSGGGFQGRFTCYTGTNSQTPDPFLAARVPLQSGWPGLTYVVLTNTQEYSTTGFFGAVLTVPTALPSSLGAVIGESNALRNISIEFQTYDTIANGGLGNELSLTGDQHIIGRDANPISCAYRVLNDPDWGIYTNEIDFTNFQTAAATCFTEGLGFSMVIDSEQEAYKVLDEIEKHIDGYIGPNPTTGLIEVKLARYDYTPANEFQANTTNIKKINDYAKPEWPQTKNEVKIRFRNRLKNYKDDHAVAQDMASRVITNRPQSVTIQYPGCRDADTANRIAARVSRTYFWPLAKFEMEMDRTAYALRPGDVVVVTHPDIDATDLICRVIRVRTGDPIEQTIKINVVVDVFRDEAGILAAPPQTEFTPPTATATAITYVETPLAPRWYLEINDQPLETRLLWLVGRNYPNVAWKVRYRHRSSVGGGNFSQYFTEGAFSPFTQYGVLQADGIRSPEVGLIQLRDTVNTGAATAAEGGEFTVEGVNIENLAGTYNNAGSYNGLAIINPGETNEEWIAIGTITSNGDGSITCSNVIRGVGESPISEHAVNSFIWFIDTGVYLQPQVRDEPDGTFSFNYALTPVGPLGDGTESAFSGEFAVSDAAISRPLAPTAVLFPQLSSTVWFPDGDLDANIPNSYTSPSTIGLGVTVWQRDPAWTNPVLAAGSLTPTGEVPGTNFMSGYNPTLNWYIYDLDVTPSPVRGDEVISGSTTGLDDRANAITIPQSEFQNASTITTPLNARLEFCWTFTTSPGYDGIIAGTESLSTFVDKQISFAPPEFSKEVYENTLLLLHFTGNVGTTKVIDYGFYDHPVALQGNLEIQHGDDDFSGPESPTPDASPAKVFPEGHLSFSGLGTSSPDTSPQTANLCRVTDVSPRVFTPDNMNPTDGYMIQARVRFNSTPTGVGLIPIVTKWRESDNNRQWWFGLNSAAFYCKHSNDGSAVLAEQSTNQTWNTGQWYELGWTVTADYVQYFRDGAFVQADFQSWGNGFDGDAQVCIGSEDDGNLADVIDMDIDEVRILKIPLYQAGWGGKYQRPYLGRERKTTLLLNWENAVGSPGATEYISDDLNRIPVIFPTGASTDSRIDTSQFKWGSQSLYCGGFTSTTTPSNVDGVWMDHTGRNYNPFRDVNYVQTDGRYEHVLDFGYEPFTCEGWVRFEVLPSAMGNDGVALFSAYHRGLTGSPFGTWGDWFFEFNNSNQLVFSYYGNEMGWGSYLPGAKSIGSPDLAVDTWYHWAISRNASGDFSIFWDGRRVFNDPGALATTYMGKAYGSRIALGRRYVTNGAARQRPLQGWLDDVRFTCGTAFYDGATYTVPTGPFTPDDREADPGAPIPSPSSPQGPPSPQSPQGPSPQSPQGVSPTPPSPQSPQGQSPQSPQGAGDAFTGSEGGWEPDDL